MPYHVKSDCIDINLRKNAQMLRKICAAPQCRSARNVQLFYLTTYICYYIRLCKKRANFARNMRCAAAPQRAQCTIVLSSYIICYDIKLRKKRAKYPQNMRSGARVVQFAAPLFVILSCSWTYYLSSNGLMIFLTCMVYGS